ncbi:unnamed protein product [Effrenium voratum]|nr:unnamed protein product [Effrenium voratum]
MASLGQRQYRFFGAVFTVIVWQSCRLYATIYGILELGSYRVAQSWPQCWARHIFFNNMEPSPNGGICRFLQFRLKSTQKGPKFHASLIPRQFSQFRPLDRAEHLSFAGPAQTACSGAAASLELEGFTFVKQALTAEALDVVGRWLSRSTVFFQPSGGGVKAQLRDGLHEVGLSLAQECWLYGANRCWISWPIVAPGCPGTVLTAFSRCS